MDEIIRLEKEQEKSNRNEIDKSLTIAKIMGWNPERTSGRAPTYLTLVTIENGRQFRAYFEPYRPTVAGLSQFGAIMLKYPNILWKFRNVDEPATQETILDAIIELMRDINE